MGKPAENAHLTDLLQAVINANIPITAIPVHGGWVEVDTVDDKQSIHTRNRLKNIMNSI